MNKKTLPQVLFGIDYVPFIKTCQIFFQKSEKRFLNIHYLLVKSHFIGKKFYRKSFASILRQFELKQIKQSQPMFLHEKQKSPYEYYQNQISIIKQKYKYFSLYQNFTLSALKMGNCAGAPKPNSSNVNELKKVKLLDRKLHNIIDQREYALLRLIYNDLSARTTDKELNIENFLLFFHKNGYWGDRLFEEFDSNSSNLISEEQFIKGIARICKTTEDEKIKLLYKFFSKQASSAQEGISFKNFLTMLYNYPKEDFKNILNDTQFFNKELKKHLISIDKEYNGKRLASIYKNEGKSKDQLNGMAFKIDETDSGGSQRLESKVGTEMIKHINKKPEKRWSSFQVQFGQNNIEVKTASLHHLVKKMAKGIFRDYNLSETHDNLKFPQFRDWMINHKNLYNDYYKGFHNEVWEIDKETHKPLCFSSKYEMESKARYRGQSKDKFIRVNLYLINSILIVCEETSLDSPMMIICLQGLLVKDKGYDKDGGYKIQISHRDGIYPVKEFFFMNQELENKWRESLKYYKGPSGVQLYDMKQKIGIGKFSIVYRCFERDTGEEYAIKVIESYKLEQQAKKLIAHESSIMGVLEHPLLVRFKESIYSKTHIYIVTQLVNGKDMFEFVKELKYLNEPEAAYILQQVLIGVRYLHGLGIVHRDLKPQNIMIEYDEKKKVLGRIKIIDFGFACYFSKLKDLSEEQSLAGTPNYMAPEVLLGFPITEKIDNFAIGSILYFALSGNLPFNGYNQSEMLQRTIDGAYNLHDKRWKQVSPNAKDLIRQLLQKEAEDRISIDEALRHPWFNDQANKKLGHLCLKEISFEEKTSKKILF